MLSRVFPFIFSCGNVKRRIATAAKTITTTTTSTAPQFPPLSSSQKPFINRRKPEMGQRNSNPAAASAAAPSSRLITRLINMRIVKNMTKNGKIARFSAIVAAGTGNGGIGCGQAKHNSGSEAVTKAGKLAVRNIQFFNRWQDRTIYHDDFVKYKATKLYVRPAPPNFGRRCHPTIAEMCRCLGIKDISAKVHGSTHPMNVMKAFLEILEKQKSPEQVAAETATRVVDVLRVFETNCRERPLRGSHTKIQNNQQQNQNKH